MRALITAEHKTIRTLFALAMVMLAPSVVHAQDIDLAWDPSASTGVAGYTVHVGVNPGVYGQSFEAGSNTTFTFGQAVPGTRYYFAVTAYDAQNNSSAYSNEVSWKINLGPTLTQPVAPAAAVGLAASLQLVATDDGDPLSYTATGLPSGLSINQSTGRISGTPTGAGSSTVNVTVSDGQLTSTRSFTWTINPRLSLNALTSSLTSPRNVGTTITFTAGGAGGVGPYQYKWWVYNGSSWTVLREWNASATYSWTPQTANANYLIAAWGRSSGNAQDAAEGGTALSQMNFAITSNLPTPLSFSAFTADRTSPQAAGTTVTFSATAVGGTSPRQFKFWVYNGSAWIVGRDWSTTSTYAWTPQSAGTGYLVAVWGRSAGSVLDGPEGVAGLAQMPYSITGGTGPTPLVVTSVTSDRTSPQAAGTTVNFTANATGGTTPRQYKWWLYNGAVWSVLRDWNTSATYAWTPQSANPTYVVAAWARNAGNTVDGPQGGTALNQVTYSITGGTGPAPLTVTGVTSSLASPQPRSTAITFTAASTGGVAPLQYKWWVFDGVTWWVTRDWGTGNTYTWTPGVAGSYVVAVWARNAGNTVDAPGSPGAVVSVAYSITSGVTPLTVTNLGASRVAPVRVNTTTTFQTTATGGTAPYHYKYWIFDGVTWWVGRNWGISNSYSWRPTVANANYVIAVWVRPASSSTDAPDGPTAVRSMVFPIIP